jgi:hypothetical protein
MLALLGSFFETLRNCSVVVIAASLCASRWQRVTSGIREGLCLIPKRGRAYTGILQLLTTIGHPPLSQIGLFLLSSQIHVVSEHICWHQHSHAEKRCWKGSTVQEETNE